MAVLNCLNKWCLTPVRMKCKLRAARVGYVRGMWLRPNSAIKCTQWHRRGTKALVMSPKSVLESRVSKRATGLPVAVLPMSATYLNSAFSRFRNPICRMNTGLSNPCPALLRVLTIARFSPGIALWSWAVDLWAC